MNTITNTNAVADYVQNDLLQYLLDKGLKAPESFPAHWLAYYEAEVAQYPGLVDSAGQKMAMHQNRAFNWIADYQKGKPLQKLMDRITAAQAAYDKKAATYGGREDDLIELRFTVESLQFALDFLNSIAV